MLENYLTGLLVCGGIIVAIGAQNAYILSQAIRREHHWWAAGLCLVSDVLLFTLGMFGVSAALMAAPQALEVLRWLGVVFLGWLALQAFVRVGRRQQRVDPLVWWSCLVRLQAGTGSFQTRCLASD